MRYLAFRQSMWQIRFSECALAIVALNLKCISWCQMTLQQHEDNLVRYAQGLHYYVDCMDMTE